MNPSPIGSNIRNNSLLNDGKKHFTNRNTFKRNLSKGSPVETHKKTIELNDTGPIHSIQINIPNQGWGKKKERAPSLERIPDGINKTTQVINMHRSPSEKALQCKFKN
jgi:hypothetical protein